MFVKDRWWQGRVLVLAIMMSLYLLTGATLSATPTMHSGYSSVSPSLAATEATLMAVRPAVISLRQGSTTRISLFAPTLDGLRLMERMWNGTQWTWLDHGPFPGSPLAGTIPVTAVAYALDGVTRINVFAVNRAGEIIERWFDGNQWNWTNHSFPPGNNLTGGAALTATSYVSNGVRRINLFVIDNVGHMIERFWNGSRWDWSDHRFFLGALALEAPAVVTWIEGSTIRHNIFVRTPVGVLNERWWDGNMWNWQNHPRPGNEFTRIDAALTGVAWYSGSVVRLNFFAKRLDGNLAERWWDGNQWNWTDHGPPPAAITSELTMVAWRAGSVQRINLFAIASGTDLIERWWDGNQWNWTNHGRVPATGGFTSAPASVTWQSGSTTRINVFAITSGRLIERWWDGNQWNWTDHGSPPN